MYAPIHTEWVFGVYAESINLTPLTECLEFMHLLTLMSDSLVYALIETAERYFSVYALIDIQRVFSVYALIDTAE